MRLVIVPCISFLCCALVRVTADLPAASLAGTSLNHLSHPPAAWRGIRVLLNSAADQEWNRILHQALP